MICNVTETTRMRAPEISDPPDSTFPHQTAIALLERLNRLEPEARATALVALPWDAATVVGLRPVMARRDIDLATALGVFFRGAPERFNYMHKHEVPAAHLAYDTSVLASTVPLRKRLDRSAWEPGPQPHYSLPVYK